MKLCIGERMGLLNILPEQGTIATMRVLRDLRHDLGFSEEELEEAGIKQTEDRLTWKPSASIEKDIAIGPAARDVVLEAIEDLDAKSGVTELTLEIYERLQSEAERRPVAIQT